MAAVEPVLGIDVGGVLVDRVAEASDTSFFGDRPMETPAVTDAFDTVAALTADVFAYRVHIVSKAGERIARLTRQWLGETGFFDITGISPGSVHFVRRRADKAPVCEALGITHFVDDRVDVLAHLDTVAHRYLFTGGLGDNPRPAPIPEGIVMTEDWPTTARAIRSTLAPADQQP